MAEKLRVLHLDDDPEDLLLVHEILDHAKADVILTQASDADAAGALADYEAFDVLLLDYRLGARTGAQVLKELRDRGILAPAVFLTGAEDQYVASDAMRAGGAEFLAKSDLTAARLIPLLQGAAGDHAKQRNLTRVDRRVRAGMEAGALIARDAPVALVAVDAQDRIVYANRSAERILGDDPVDQIPEDVLGATAARTWAGMRIHERFYDVALSVQDGLRIISLADATERIASGEREHFAQRDLLLRRSQIAEVAAVVAHDVRNMLRRARLDEKEGPAHFGILDNVDQVLKELVDYARLGLDDLVIDALPLGEMTAAAVGLLDPSLPHLKENVSVGTLPEVQGNPLQVREVFVNLFHNVYLHSSETAKISVSSPGPGVVVVRDDGPPIDPEIAEKMFRPFRVVRDGSLESSKHVGLAYCRRIMNLMGGSIDYEAGAFVLRFAEAP